MAYKSTAKVSVKQPSLKVSSSNKAKSSNKPAKSRSTSTAGKTKVQQPKSKRRGVCDTAKTIMKKINSPTK